MSRDVDVGHAHDCGAGGDIWREQAERVRFALGLDRPPDRVVAREARGDGGLMPEWADVASEGGEDDGALVRLVVVLEEELGHVASLASRGSADIGAPP